MNDIQELMKFRMSSAVRLHTKYIYIYNYCEEGSVVSIRRLEQREKTTRQSVVSKSLMHELPVKGVPLRHESQ